MPKEYKSVSLDGEFYEEIDALRKELAREWSKHQGITVEVKVPQVLKLAVAFYKQRRKLEVKS
jgi:hypothetical protein